MNRTNGFITRMDARLDSFENKLKKRQCSIPTDLLGGILFFVFGLVMLFVIPQQIDVKKKELINGRAFPNLLMYIMIACSAILIISQIVKIIRKQEIKRTTINLLVEFKALLIFLSLIVFWQVAQGTGNFAVGAVTFGVLMLLIFRCKKPLYYGIVIAAAVIIWAAFRFGLKVLF